MKVRTAIISTVIATALLAGCKESTVSDLGLRAERPLPQKIVAKMKAKGMTRTSPIMVRIFKEENTLEIWKQKNNGRYDLIASYEICKWSGKLGPKFIEGDRQAPEGFYIVRPSQMNPKSSYYLSFNIGFPNAYDRAHGRTGQHLMVHGACSSSGCYSMTDESVAEIYAFGRDAFKGGQREFQIQAFPFRMTPANMARYRNDPNYEFWKMLKQGYDAFEMTKVPPKVDVCEKRYVFNNPDINGGPADQPCPPSAKTDNFSTAYADYHKSYETAFSAALSSSNKPPAPSIQGLAEAKLVAAWSAARARGEKVSRVPPSLTPASSEKPGAPDIRPAAPAATAIAATPKAESRQPSQEQTASIPASKPEAATSAAVPAQAPVAATPAAEDIAATGQSAPATTEVAANTTPATGATTAETRKPWWKILGK